MGRGSAEDDANTQLGFNQDSLNQVIGANQLNQKTPWGSINYTGDIGSPDRQQHIQLNPYDQQALGMQRGARQQILGALLGGVPGMEGAPQIGGPGAGGGKGGGQGGEMPQPDPGQMGGGGMPPPESTMPGGQTMPGDPRFPDAATGADDRRRTPIMASPISSPGWRPQQSQQQHQGLAGLRPNSLGSLLAGGKPSPNGTMYGNVQTRQQPQPGAKPGTGAGTEYVNLQTNQQQHQGLAGLRPNSVSGLVGGNGQTQPQQGNRGILGNALSTIGTPFSFQGAPQVQQSQYVAPAAAPAAASYSPSSHSAPVSFSGPSNLGYSGQRVDVGPSYQAPGDVNAVGASQQGQFSIDANARTNPSQTFNFNPYSGQYYQSPGAMRNRLPGSNQFGQQVQSLEDATYQRGMNQMQPRMQQQREQLSQRLANQGLPVGSEAHTAEMNRMERSQNAALENLALSSVGAGRQEHSRITGLAAGLNQQEFGQAMSRKGFDSSEARRQFGERLGATQFNAGEAGRGFNEQLSSSQADFGQRFNAVQFDAAESSRRFQELMAGQSQEHGINMANRQYSSGEAGRMFGQRMGSENQFFGQQQAADQFRALQANRADQMRVQQQQFGDQYNAQQGMFGAQFGAQQAQQNWANQFAGNQFNAAQQNQMFNQGMQHRNQWTQEQLMQRGLPMQEVQQLLGLAGQVSNPQFQGGAQYGPMGVDYMGARANQGNQMAGLAGGLGQAGMMALAMSDRRRKTKIKKLREFSPGIFWHSYEMDGVPQVGFIAQDVEKVLPAAVIEGADGFKRLNYMMVFNAAS